MRTPGAPEPAPVPAGPTVVLPGAAPGLGAAPRARDAALVAVAAALWLLLLAPFLEPGRLHVSGLGRALNDQVGYVSAARNLAEHGVLANRLVYPSILAHDGGAATFYMPGHFLALAAAYAVLGYGELQSVLPGLLAFVLAATAVFFVGATLHGRSTGLLAALLFAAFPANPVFASTAMSELPLVAAACAALAVFVRLRAPLRPWFGPFLVAVPFLFRETGAFVALPMAFLIGGEPAAGRRTRALAFALATVVLLAALYGAPFSAERPSLLYANLVRLDEARQYGELGAAELGAHPPAEWARALAVSAVANTRTLSTALITRPHTFEWASMALFLAAGAFALVSGARARPRAPFALGAGSLVLALLLFALVFHRLDGWRGPRLLLLGWPVACVVLAAAWLGPARGGGPVPRLRRGAIALAAAAGFAAAAAMGSRVTALDAADARDTRLLEALDHDDAELLVTPDAIGLDYTLRHAPVRWSFPPWDEATLARLAGLYPIGTLIVPSEAGRTQLDPEALARVGLVPLERFQWGPEELSVFVRAGDRERRLAARARRAEHERPTSVTEVSGGVLDRVDDEGSAWRLAGWSALPGLGRLPAAVHVLAGEELIAVIERFHRRRDVAVHLGDRAYVLSGFELHLPHALVPPGEHALRLLAFDAVTRNGYPLEAAPGVPATVAGPARR